MRDGFRQPLGVSMAAASLLLLIVCLNVSHLLLARAVGRQREVTIRAALGATRARLLRQLLAEALLLAGLGAVAAAAVRRWISEGLLFMAAIESQARSLDVGADGRAVAFTVLVTLATAALIGGVPAWQLSSRGAHLHGALRETSHLVADGRSRGTARGLLLASQVALSLVLLVGAGLLYATLGKMRALGEGFYEDHVLLADLRVKGTGPVETRNAVYGDLISRVSALPGVLGAGAATYPPLGGSSTGATLLLPDRGPEPVEIDFVTPGYLEALGIGTIAGRGFDRRDRQGAPRVAVVNETFARRFFSRGDVASALGRRIRFDPTKKPKMLGADFDVVGVVKDAKTRALKQEPGPAAYLSVDQADRFSVGSLAIRVDPRAGSPARLGQRIRRVLQDHPGVAATSVTLTTMREQLERSLRHERLLALLAGAFGLAALSLVCLGLYGVISQWAAQRSAEIGVRVALGAPPAGVRWMVMRQALALVAAGVAVGLPAALGASHLLRGALFGVEPMDPPTFTLAAAAMLAVTMAAAYLPARRATRTDPMTALRHE
jgi:predicted permease